MHGSTALYTWGGSLAQTWAEKTWVYELHMHRTHTGWYRTGQPRASAHIIPEV